MKVLKIVPHSWKFLNNHENICIVCKSGLFHIILNSLSIILSQLHYCQSILIIKMKKMKQPEREGGFPKSTEISWSAAIMWIKCGISGENGKKWEQEEIKIGIWNRNCQDVLLEHLEQKNRTGPERITRLISGYKFINFTRFVKKCSILVRISLIGQWSFWIEDDHFRIENLKIQDKINWYLIRIWLSWNILVSRISEESPLTLSVRVVSMSKCS